MPSERTPYRAVQKFFRPIALAAILGCVLSGGASVAEAQENKLDLQLGYFSLTGKTASRSGSISGLGAYRVGFRRRVLPRIDLGLGYTLMYSQIITGDSTFGLDVNATYFPFSLSGQADYRVGGQGFSMVPVWRPYLNLGFNQRNIQSVQTSYAGFSVAAGTERTLRDSMSVNFMLRYSALSGPRDASATILEFLGGLCVGF